MKKTLKVLLLFFLFQIKIVYAEEFDITSKYVILYNMNEGKVLYESKSDEKTQIASLTKVMTTIVAIEKEPNLDAEVTFTKEMLKGIEEYTQVGFKVGNKATVRDLLYGAMLPSGADAVNALAIHVGGSMDQFVEFMNQKAKELKLENTHFDNPVGMDGENNYSTAGDIAKLLIYSLKNNTFKEIFQTREYQLPSLNKTLKSTLIGYSRSYGLDVSQITGAKSGFTDGAGLCLASTSTIDDVDYLLITIGADTKNRSNAVRDTLEIYDYYSSSYSYQTVVKKDQKFKKIPIKWGKKKEYQLTADQDIQLYLSNDVRKNRIKYTYEGINELNYKIKKGDRLGTIKVVYENDILTTYDLYLKENLEYYHPVLYGVIVLSVVIMIWSIKTIFHNRRRRKNRAYNNT